MKISKRKLSADFTKTFQEKIYSANINLSSSTVKTFIVEENRDDVKVVFEGNKDLISNVNFDIVDDVLNIGIVTRKDSGLRSSSVIIHSVFTTENKLSIYLPLHFKNYEISGDDVNLRINNVIADKLHTKYNKGILKLKYCTFEKSLNINSNKSSVSVKSVESNGNITIINESGVTKFRDVDCACDICLETFSGVVNAKNIKGQGRIDIVSENGTIDLDDVYGKAVSISAKNSVVNYFNGNLNKKFDVNINVDNGIVRTNVKRDEIH